MSDRSVQHATFSIERTYAVPPAAVFAAWSDATNKQKWSVGPPGWSRQAYSLDFTVGGKEHSEVGPDGGPSHIYDARYEDIVPDERLVFSYQMRIGEKRISASLATVELRLQVGGTAVTFTEQAAFLDGYDDAGSREMGTNSLLDLLGAHLEQQ
jgi:uncharacterized protein YndB with AHSA1/START domain